MTRLTFRLFAFAGLCLALVLIGIGGAGGSAARAQAPSSAVKSTAATRGAPVNQTYMVDGVRRTALIYLNTLPVRATGLPVLFVFHGHGGTAQFVARRFRLHELWPEAIVVYMQGLPGVAGITDQAGEKPGWQKNPGEVGDRDLKFVDVALADVLKKGFVDSRRIYALGHSNGARFVNVLWKMRSEVFAAFCSASAQGGLLLRDVAPRSIFMIAGEKDPLVPYQTQVLSVDLVRKRLQIDPSKAETNGYARFEQGINGTELVTYLHPGGHEFPSEALPLAVEFFKRHTLKN
jgi:polyhydroxybutyrate depolymerase